MQRVVLILFALALAAAGALLAWQGSATARPAPMPAHGAPDPAPTAVDGVLRPADGNVATTTTAAPAEPGSGDAEAAARTAVARGVRPERVRVDLTVHVRDEQDAPVPNVDVLMVPFTGSADLGGHGAGERRGAADVEVARTDQAGRAQLFAIVDPTEPEACGVVVRTALGGQQLVELLAEPSRRKPLPPAVSLEVTLRLVPRFHVEGMVVDARGNGVPRADLVVVPWNAAASLAAGSTDATGRFRIGLSGATRISACHPEFSPSPLASVQPPPGSVPTATGTVNLRLTLLGRPARIAGEVVDGSGAAVPGARLAFGSAELVFAERAAAADATGATGAQFDAVPDTPPRYVRTDATGRFAVADLPPGRVSWAARAAGFGCARGSIDAGDEHPAFLRVVMQPGANVEGFVYDVNGAAVAGAVVWSARSAAFDSVRARSAADGSYRLVGVGAGTAALSARRSPTARTAATTELALTAGETTRWNVVVPADAEGAGPYGTLLDTAGQRLEGWRLVLRGAGPARTVTTGAEGRFPIPALPTPLPPLAIDAYAPGQAFGTFAVAALRGVVREDPWVLAIDRSQPPARIVGLVHGAAQAPLAAELDLWHQERRANARYAAAADGRFRIDGVPAGTIDVVVRHADHSSAVLRDVRVAAGEELDLGAIALGTASAIHGQVTGPDGQPPASLEIAVLTDERQIPGVYAQGTYRIADVPPGRHALLVQGRGVAGARFEIVVAAGVELQQDIKLHAGVARRIRIAVPPAAGTWVSLTLRPSAQPHVWVASQATAGAAEVEFVAYMAPGTYDAAAYGQDGWRAAASVPFVAGDDAPVRLELQRR